MTMLTLAHGNLNIFVHVHTIMELRLSDVSDSELHSTWILAVIYVAICTTLSIVGLLMCFLFNAIVLHSTVPHM